MTFFEDLAVKGTCPPEDALLPDGQQEYFRVVKHNPATSECFISHRMKYPKREFPDECAARSVSLSDSIDTLIRSYFKTPAGKKIRALVGIVILEPNDGMVKQTYAPGHHSWWRSDAFDPATVKIEEVER